MKHIITTLAALLLVPLSGLHAAGASDPPNIVIILVDDMGYGDPGCYNPQSKIPTPNIDRLAREGMRFTDAHAPGPLCHPSRYGLMTNPHFPASGRSIGSFRGLPQKANFAVPYSPLLGSSLQESHRLRAPMVSKILNR